MSEKDNKRYVKKILVVDDDPTHVKLMHGILTANNYDAITETDAAAGLQIAMEKNIDLIILDVMMPIINGYNFCQMLKKENLERSIPVILVTSRDEKEDIEIMVKRNPARLAGLED